MTEITARDEIRVSEFGLLRCPSCGELAAELLGRHNLVFTLGETLVTRENWRGAQALLLSRSSPWCECRDGERVPLEDYQTTVAAANIAVADDAWFRTNRALAGLGWPGEMLWGKAPA